MRDLPGFRTNTLPRNDDGSAGPVPIGFEINFFGRNYTALYVNNNGNVTFESALSQYVPFGLSGTRLPIIAAFFADVDTRPPGSGVVTYGNAIIDGRRAFGVNYFSVGYFNEHAEHLNTFQLILINRDDAGIGDFDIEFNYDEIQWDRAGDVAAVAGFSNGTGDVSSLFQLPGSMSNGAFVDGGPNSLAEHSLNSRVPGRYIFQARSGTVSFLRIITPTLPAGTVEQPYSAPRLVASGGIPPYTWSAVNWPPKAGLTLNTATGEISGVPRNAGQYQLTIEVGDGAKTPPARRIYVLQISEAAQPEVTPYLIEPQQATVNEPVKLVAGLRLAGQSAPASNLPRHFTVKANISGQSVELHDDGLEGDDVAGDGRYTANVIFTQAGVIPVTIEALGGTLNRSGEGVVKVWGNVVNSGGPIFLDLGTIKAGGESCQPLVVVGTQQGQVPLEFQLMQTLPDQHSLSLRANQKAYSAGDPPLVVGPNDRKEICLNTRRNAPSSQGGAQPWIKLVMMTANGKRDLATVNLRWSVQALTFWEVFGSLVLAVLAVLVILFFIYGYVRPARFPRELALTFVPDYEDLDASPQPLTQWPGVRIGFYRDAKAFLHPDFRVSGRSKGALAMLKASKQGVWVVPVGGILYREIDFSDWEEVQVHGRLARTAVPYRVSDRGPFFRISSSLGKKPAS